MTDHALQEAQREALRIKLFAAFEEWAKAAGWDVSAWKVGDAQTAAGGDAFGLPVTPLGDAVSFYDAACSLQRIAEMRTLNPSTVAGSFYHQGEPEDVPQLPCQMNKQGQVPLVIWAIWDGESQVGPVTPARGLSPGGEAMPCPAHPSKPSVLVSLEGCGPELGKWTDPVKLYSFLEFGYKLGRYVPTTDASLFDDLPRDDGSEDIPF